MADIKITSKRQATLPAELCTDLGLHPGDRVHIEKRIIDGKRAWVLVPKTSGKGWFGSLRRYARGKRHDMEKIRKAIGKAVAEGESA